MNLDIFIICRNNDYFLPLLAWNVGNRKCDFEGCNALEFRTSRYCLRHKGGLPDEKRIYSTNPTVGIPYEKDKRSLASNPLLIPIIALGYVPFVIFWLFMISFGSDPFAGYYFFIYSGMCLFILMPFYAIYLIFLTWRRYKNGTLTLFVSIIHILSLIVPLWYLIIFATFSGSPAWYSLVMTYQQK